MDLINALLSNIPVILRYYIPGYCAIILCRQLRNDPSEKSEVSAFTGSCVCISYIISAFMELFLPASSTNAYLLCLLSILVGFVCAVIFIRLLKFAWVRNLYNRINKTTLQPTIWKSNIDYNSQRLPNIEVLCSNDIVYCGRLIQNGVYEYDKWICMDTVKMKNTSGEVIRDCYSVEHRDNYERMLIPMDEIQHVLIKYKDGDAKFPSWYGKKLAELRHSERAK